MASEKRGPANRLLGYPEDARLLILNADDFGMCQAVNAAIIGALLAGVIRSTTVMVPCPWSPQALRFLAAHPEIPFGVHLTVMSDPADYRWGPVAAKESVPSLVDRGGYFYDFDRLHARLAQMALDELEIEFRAQIESVLSARLSPTHLDWHALRFGPRADIKDLITGLAKEYGLALRVIGRDWIESLQRQNLPVIEYDFLDSYSIDPHGKPEHYARLLRELPAGLSEWAIHPGLDTPELRAIDFNGSRCRQSDFDFFTSQRAKELVMEEGIILLDYRGLQAHWEGLRKGT